MLKMTKKDVVRMHSDDYTRYEKHVIPLYLPMHTNTI